MEDHANLKDNINALRVEMGKLKELMKDSGRGGERGMDAWSQNVREKEREFEGIQKEFNDLSPESFPFGNIRARKKLNKKVVENYKLVIVLREMAVEISQTMETFISQVATEKTLRFSPWQIRKYTSDFTTELGSGGFGDVYLGKLPNGVKIAVKKLKDGVMDDMEKQFMAEVRLMGTTYHRNLVRLYGFCFDGELKALVYEYMQNGSLDKILFDNHLDLQWKKLYRIAVETAKALSYLHENCHERIIHRDIKAGNVLLDSNHTAKVSDFGLAKLCSRDKSHVTITGLREMRGYDAPEVRMEIPRITYKCDIFSFGMMLFEVLSRRICDVRNSFPRHVWMEFENGKLEEIIRDCNIAEKDIESARTVCIIAFWCIQYRPETRPPMSTVVKALEGEIIFTQPPNPFQPANIPSSACISRASSTRSG